MAIMVRGTLPVQTTRAGIKKVYFNELSQLPTLYDKVANVSTSDRGFEDYIKSSGFGRMSVIEEGESIPYDDVRDRILYIQALETIRCLEENVLESVRDANIGSIFGIGFPAWTGGAIQFVNHVGVNKFVERSEQLRQRYGERFAAPALLREHQRHGTPF